MALTDAGAAAPGTGTPPVFPRPRGPRRVLGTWRRQLVAALVVAAALGFLIFQGLTNATVYFKTADQAVADKASLGSRPFRIEGTVQSDVARNASATTFSIFQNGTTVRVVDSAQPPQLFRPGIPVVLEGHWQGDVYAADLIMVKHTASYSEAHPDRLKPQRPTP